MCLTLDCDFLKPYMNLNLILKLFFGVDFINFINKLDVQYVSESHLGDCLGYFYVYHINMLIKHSFIYKGDYSKT